MIEANILPSNHPADQVKSCYIFR